MKFLYSTDGHLSATRPIARKEKTDEEYIETQLNKRKQMYDYADMNNIMNLIDGGDFFNAWNPKELPTLLIEYLNLRKKYSFEDYVDIGNHDLKFHNLDFINDSALGILKSLGMVTIVDDWIFHTEDGDIKLNFFHFGQELNQRELIKGINIAIVHENIFEKQIPPYMTGYTIEQLRETLPGYDLYLCGHNHQKFCSINKDYIVLNGGSVMRLNTKQKNFKPSFWEIEIVNGNVGVKEIPFDIESDMISTEHLKKNKIESFVESTKEFEELDGFDFKKDVENAIKKDKPIDKVKEKIYSSMEEE